MVELIIVSGLVVLGVSMFIRHRREHPPVDMDHQAPNVHNVVSKTPFGHVAVAAPAKKVSKKKATTKKKTTKKKVSTKKK